ncbi:hypothetical protein BH11ACT6_BH11ACT6_40010 [soil metagenome]
MPSAVAAPAYDSQGYLESTARCASPAQAMVFGSTSASRVAICETPSGTLQYRGVRVRDGARLILPATDSGDQTFVADNDGATYEVTEDALVVSIGTRVIREESMLDFHAPNTSGTTSAPSTAPTEPTTAAPDPNLPPLPAEVGGSGS